LSGDTYTVILPDVKYTDMLLLVQFIYGGEVKGSLKQLSTLQDLIQLLQLDPGHLNGKFVIENIDSKSFSLSGTGVTTSVTVVGPPPPPAIPSSSGAVTVSVPVALPIHVPVPVSSVLGGGEMDLGPMPSDFVSFLE